MNVINLEVELLGSGKWEVSITNLLGNFSLQQLESDKFKEFISHCLHHVVDYGDYINFEEDLDDGYVFMTLEKWIQDGEVRYGNVKTYYQPLI